MRAYIMPRLGRAKPQTWLLAGLGGLLGIGAAQALSITTGFPWLMAPFGASCVLLFSVPASPLSQPPNVVGGHVLATAVGLGVHAIVPEASWAVPVAVGLAIAAMAACGLTHPPAGADPLVVYAVAPGPGYLVFPVFVGSVLLVATAVLYHRLTGTTYPTGPV